MGQVTEKELSLSYLFSTILKLTTLINNSEKNFDWDLKQHYFFHLRYIYVLYDIEMKVTIEEFF